MKIRSGIPGSLLGLVGAVALLAVPSPARADSNPRLRLIDLNATGQSALSPFLDGQTFVSTGAVAYFSAWTADAGLELWRTNGVGSGTHLIADLTPGPMSSVPSQLTPSGAHVFFLASASNGLEQLCVTGDSMSGLRTLATSDTWPMPITIIGATDQFAVFISPVDERVGLWRVDADSAPRLLATVTAGPVGRSLGGSDVVAHQGRLYFAADDGIHGRELWSTDGTPEGTLLVADIVPGPQGSSPSSLASVDHQLLLAASTPRNGVEPWICDADDVRLLTDVDSGADPAANSWPEGFTLVENRIIFAATSEVGRELFVIEDPARPSSTRLLADIRPGAGDGIVGPFAPVRIGGFLFFAADDGLHGPELWRTDGTPGGTRLCTDLRPGPVGSRPATIGGFAGAVVFQAADSDDGYRLWRFDPVTLTLPPVRLSGLPLSDDDTTNRTQLRPWSLVGRWLVYPAFRPDVGLELFRARSEPAAPELIADIRPGTTGSAPGQFSRAGNAVILAARNELGIEPWFSDGTAAGTRMIADVAPGRASGSPTSIIGGEQFTVFRSGGQWWQTSPAFASSEPADTHQLGVSEPQQSSPPRAIRLGQRLILAARTQTTGDEVFITDGRTLAEGGTTLLADIVPGPASSSPFGFTRIGNQVLFFTQSPATDRGEIWRTDGTAAGTSRVITIVNPLRSRAISTAVRPVDVRDRIYFVADDGSGDELWVSDGTDEGTFRVMDIRPGPESSNPTNLVALDVPGEEPRVFFAASDGASGVELWVSGGASFGADTRRVRDIAAGPGSGSPLTITAGRLSRLAAPGVCFAATDNQTGWELYFSDGTESGTIRLSDFRVPAPQSPPSAGEPAVQAVLGIAGGAVYFRVIDPGVGSLTGQLYRSRGTVNSLWPVRDDAGRTISPFSAMLPVNSRVFFSATDPSIGSELAVLDLCPADFDNSGLVEIGDLFSFLDAFLSEITQTGARLRADLSNDQRVTIDDLLVFLNQYFAGCN